LVGGIHSHGTTASDGRYSLMKRDPFDTAIDDILANAGGDARRALRAVLEENVQLEFELRNLYAASEHDKRTDTKKPLH
jgi:hypothetical protein